MLTISQLAAYAGVTVRAVRHYHAKGLLPEPERDHSGYRRYDAAAAVRLIRIRTLAEAGVPLSRVQELLAADDSAFTAAIGEIDQRLRAEIRERERHRQRIARLAAGDSLALPPEAVSYLQALREAGVSDEMVDAERDAWILVAAQLPERMPFYMEMKSQQLHDPRVRELYRDLTLVVRCGAEDPRLDDVADRRPSSRPSTRTPGTPGRSLTTSPPSSTESSSTRSPAPAGSCAGWRSGGGRAGPTSVPLGASSRGHLRVAPSSNKDRRQ